MAKINVSTELIVDLLKWGVAAGADAIAARKVLQANKVDPAVYERVIADKRTFQDFHGTNPQKETVEPPVVQPPPVTGGVATSPSGKLDWNPMEDMDRAKATGYPAGSGVFHATKPPSGTEAYWILYPEAWMKIGFAKSDGLVEIGRIT